MKKLLKRIVLLMGTVCLCFIGVTFLGTSKEAQAASYSVGTYAELVDACGKGSSNTITLTADITLTGTVTVKGNVNLNGNGRIIRPSNAANCFEIESGGKLTVSNLTVDRSSHPEGNVFYVKDRGALVVKGGTYRTGNGSAGQGASVINAFGMVTIDGGTFCGAKRDFYAVCLLGAYNYVVNDGVFTQNTSGLGTNLNTNTNPSATQSITINGGEFYGNDNNGTTVGEPSRSQTGTTTAYINGGSFHDNGLNGVSVCYENQTANIKNVTIYNNKQTGIYVMGSTVNFVGNASEKVLVQK